MKKIVSLYKRDHESTKKVFDELSDGCKWVADGEGVATRKWDGMAVMVKDGVYFKRYDAKAGRTPPYGFVPAQPEADPASGHWPGWIVADGADSKWVLEAISNFGSEHRGKIPDGTYEACGPKIGTRHGKNPENLSRHILVKHGADILPDCPRTFKELMEYLRNSAIEGIVWHHPDGRMAKIKKSDFPY